MTAHPAHIAQMEARLRSLSLDSNSVTTQAEHSSDGANGRADGRARRSRWTALALLWLVGAASGAYFTLPGWNVFTPDAEHVQILPQKASLNQLDGADATSTAIDTLATVPPLPQVRQIVGSGYSRAEQDVTLGAPQRGRIASVAFKEGDMVAAGAPLLQMDDRDADEAVTNANVVLDQATLDVEATELRVAQLSDTQAKLDMLLERGAITATDVSKNAYALATAQVEARRAVLAVQSASDALKSARANLADQVLRAPFDGILATVNATPGMMVEGLQHDALLRLFNPASLVVDVDIAERNISEIYDGLGAKVVFDAWPNQSFDGAVTSIAPVLSRERGTLRVSITLSAPPAVLRPNMAARATLAISKTLPDQPQDAGKNDVKSN